MKMRECVEIDISRDYGLRGHEMTTRVLGLEGRIYLEQSSVKGCVPSCKTLGACLHLRYDRGHGAAVASKFRIGSDFSFK
jgi:hypothetical protein